MVEYPNEIYAINNCDQPVPEVWSKDENWQNCTKYIRHDLHKSKIDSLVVLLDAAILMGNLPPAIEAQAIKAIVREQDDKDT